MTKKPTQFECCLGIILSLYGYSPEGFKDILHKEKYKQIKVDPRNPFSELYNKLDPTYDKIKPDDVKKNIWTYLNKKKNLTLKLSELDNTNKVTELIGILNLLVNDDEEFKSECLNLLQSPNVPNQAVLSIPETFGKGTYPIGHNNLSRLLKEFKTKYAVLNNDEFQSFHSNLKCLWDDESDEILEKIKKKKLIEFEEEPVEITIKFSEFYSGCEKRIFLREGDRMRIFKIQIDPLDENLDKEVDGCQFRVEVDKYSKFDIDDNGMDLLYYFDDNDKVGQYITLYTGKNIKLEHRDLNDGATIDILSNNDLKFEGMPHQLSIRFIDVKENSKKTKPEKLNVNLWRGSKKGEKTPAVPTVKETSQSVDTDFMDTREIPNFQIEKAKIRKKSSDSSDETNGNNNPPLEIEEECPY